MTNLNDSPSDARRTTDAVLNRDRRRIRRLAALSIGLWVIAALLIPSVYLPLGGKLKQFAKMLDAANPGATDPLLHDRAPDYTAAPPTTQEIPVLLNQVRHQTWMVSQIVIHEWIVGAIILVFALATGFLASVATVAMALSIRRVTLRHVNESLWDISNQLRQLQQQKS